MKADEQRISDDIERAKRWCDTWAVGPAGHGEGWRHSCYRLALEVERLRKVERAMNPRTWTEQQNAAWHSNLPDVQKAFAALMEASN